MNFEPLLALPGGATRSACIGRICRGHQGGSFDLSSSRARPPLPQRCKPPTAQSLPSPRVPKIASGTPACAAHASYACMHPIPTALRHPCSPRCPPHPHFLALCGAPQSTPQTPTDFCAARGAPLSADHELGLCRGLLFTNHRMLQSNKGVLSFLFVVFQMADVPRGGRRHEPRGPRAAWTSIFFVFLRQ